MRVTVLFCFGFKMGKMRACTCVHRNHPTGREKLMINKKEGR